MKLRKVKTCLLIVLSVRLSSYKRIQNIAINATNFTNTTTDHAHGRIVKLMHEVLKYDLMETSLISNLDSYNEQNQISTLAALNCKISLIFMLFKKSLCFIWYFNFVIESDKFGKLLM